MALTKFNFNSFDVTSAANKGLGFNASANGFSTIDPGAMTLIKTLTASSSANLTFTHGSSDVVLNNTYPIYVFKFINIHPESNSKVLRMNGSIDDSNFNVAKTTTQIEVYNEINDASRGLQYRTDTDLANATTGHTISTSVGNGNDESCSGFFYLFNPASTTFQKHFFSRVQGHHGSDYSIEFVNSGLFNTTSAITSIQFSMSSGNIDSGTIKLYGVSDS